jgi:Tfp pilus assembly protein PilV
VSRHRSRAHRVRLRTGTSLLEVMVSLVLLGTSGTGLIVLMGQSVHGLRQVHRAERDVQGASDELGRFVVYDRAQMLASVGRSTSHGWLVTVAQRAADLFDVVIADTITNVPILRTTLYRPDTIDVGPP